MTTLHTQEPNTNGKVILTTNRGDIEIELWSKEAPKACRNFVQLCMEGYYVDTLCHRVVPGFLLQFGDPTATGQGGQSIWDEPFEDELHNRLRWNRRGLVGMVSVSGRRNDNGSQFFVTLAETPELQGMNTLFGRVVGQTIYNVDKIGRSECMDERPLYATVIQKTEVIVNPFDDIAPRTTLEELRDRRRAQELQARASKKPRPKPSKAIALSFGDDDDEGDAAGLAARFAKKKVKTTHLAAQDEEPAISSNKQPTVANKAHQSIKQTKSVSQAQDSIRPERPALKVPPPTSNVESVPRQLVKEQIAALRDQLRGKQATASADEPDGQATVDPPFEKPRSSLAALQAQYKAKSRGGKRLREGRLHSGSGAGAGAATDEDATMAKLRLFQAKLGAHTVTDEEESSRKPADGQHRADTECLLHGVPGCMSCFDRLGEIDEGEGEDEAGGSSRSARWLSHKLEFAEDRLGKDLSFKQRAEDDLIVIDPRTKAGQLALAEREGKNRSRTRAT
ncbi:Peptidyl-prolyl isomerase cwc27 [Savitreella phatthalungensis]